jgi:hypothetical protein
MFKFISRYRYHVFEAAVDVSELLHVSFHSQQKLSVLLNDLLLLVWLFLLDFLQKRETAERLLVFILSSK